MRLNKKPISQSSDRGVEAWMEQVSKAFLADLVIDLIRRNEGNEDLDGADLLTAIIADAEPITVARNDRLPPADFWEREMVKYARRRWAYTGSDPVAARAAHAAHVQRIKDAVLAARPNFAWPDSSF